MNAIRVTAHDRTVSTPFGLIGKDENALTHALGYTFSRCPRLLQRFLGEAGIKGVRLSALRSARIDLQRRRRDGITDLEIHIPNQLYVIIEAKIGLSLPSLDQLQKYLPRFDDKPRSQQKLVALVETDSPAAWQLLGARNERLDELLVGVPWADLIPHCIDLRAVYPQDSGQGRWLRWFQRFLEEEYKMKCYTEEVWIVSASRQPLWEGGMSFLDTHLQGKVYYRGANSPQRPLYIAFRYGGEVKAIQRVIKVEPEQRPIDVLPQLANVPEDWPRHLHTVWYLGEPTPLPQAIPSSDPHMRGRRLSLDLDILLSSASIKEAVQKMKIRREHDG